MAGTLVINTQVAEVGVKCGLLSRVASLSSEAGTSVVDVCLILVGVGYINLTQCLGPVISK